MTVTVPDRTVINNVTTRLLTYGALIAGLFFLLGMLFGQSRALDVCRQHQLDELRAAQARLTGRP